MKQFNWYPGIDAEHVKPKLDPATWQKLFAENFAESAGGLRQKLPDYPLL